MLTGPAERDGFKPASSLILLQLLMLFNNSECDEHLAFTCSNSLISVIMSSSQHKIQKSPNFFLAFKIDDQLLVNSLEETQKKIIQESEKEGSLQCRTNEMLIPLDKMHVTGILLVINSNFMLQGIVKVLEYCAKMLYLVNMNNLSLKIRGLSHFNNGRVVYAGIEEDVNYALLKITLKTIFDQIKKEFPTALYTSSFEFQPHLTIFKAKRYCRAKVSNDFFKPFENETFGTQIVSGFDLLGMEGTKEGYYIRYATMRFDGTVEKGLPNCRLLERYDKEILERLSTFQNEIKQLEVEVKENPLEEIGTKMELLPPTASLATNII